MKFLLLAILFCACVGSLCAKKYNGTVKHDGLKEDGKQVCYYMTTFYKQVNVSFLQETVRVRYYKSCGWTGCTVKSRNVIVKVTRYFKKMKQFDLKNLYCCNGWMRESPKSDECIKPICSVACRNGGECVAPNTCKCKEGFDGDYCQYVINDCADKTRNKCQQVCISLIPGHRCSCKHGWKLKKDRKHCRDIDECLRKVPPCKCKVEDGVCKAACNNLEGSYECKCNKGYRLTSAQECEDINECFLDPDLCDQVCVNKPGTYFCKCMDGYELNNKTMKCVDIDECKDHNGGCSDDCNNIDGSYLCTCPHGFYLGKDRKTCILIKPTMKNKVICQSELVGELNCGSYEEKIIIIDAMYGRLTKEYCQFGNYTQNLRCSSKVSPLKHLQAACDNQASCVIFLEKKIFGDPCPLIEKYMQVTYDCMK